MPLVAGIDSSTQSCTVELRDADDGALLGTGRAPHPVTHPPLSEQDPAAWWHALATALALACRDAGVRPGSIDSRERGPPSVTAWSPSTPPARSCGLPNCGTTRRPQPQAAGLVARYGARNWVRATGLTPTAALTVTKLAWLAEHEPGNLRAPHHRAGTARTG
ncbi:hypothetical protein GCM10017559_44830 [Streptosporangium longisporum]|uniref:Carbohydrate kinase FGGY N-terminal domain-containing protein n=1 Tax=Streptosporangium longisporum TaxID=46187 RepID=A0ABP6KRV2_9ACTN